MRTYTCIHILIWLYRFCKVYLKHRHSFCKTFDLFSFVCKKNFPSTRFLYFLPIQTGIIGSFVGSVGLLIIPLSGVGNLSVLNDGHQIFSPRGTNIFRFRVSIIFFKLLCNLEKKPSHCLVLNMSA